MEILNIDTLPNTLLDLLLNPILSDNLYQYLSRTSIFRLARTNRQYRNIILSTPRLFRFLDLSNCKGAYTPSIAPLDNGGHSWRAERIDDNLSWDEFCSAPLQFVFNKLEKLRALQDVQTLMLDGLGSVTHGIVNDIITSARYNVRLLSIRGCPNVNQHALQRILVHACRPSRPGGTPRLKGLYYFTNPALDSRPNSKQDVSFSVMDADGATLGLLPSEKGHDISDNAHVWYTTSGQAVAIGAEKRTSWEETLRICSGIIAFDVVLCTSMHEHMDPVLHEASREFLISSKPGVPTIASVALGPDGCSGCGCAPAGTPVWGQSDISEFPLLAPPPRSGKLIDAIQPPSSHDVNHGRLIVSCKWCLVNRHCDSCHRWWCADCYNPKVTNKLKDLESLSDAGLMYLPTTEELSISPGPGNSRGDSIKVFNGFCVENCLVGEMMAGAGAMGMWA